MTDCVWYYIDNGRQQGPVSEATLGEMIRSGQMGSQSMVWCPGCPNWIALSQHPALQQLLLRPAAGAPQYSMLPVPSQAVQSAAANYGYNGNHGNNGNDGNRQQNQCGAGMDGNGANGYSSIAPSALHAHSTPDGSGQVFGNSGFNAGSAGCGQSTVDDLSRLLSDVQSKAANRADVDGQEITYFTVYNRVRQIYRVYGLDQQLLFLRIGYLPQKDQWRTKSQPELFEGEGKTAAQHEQELNETMARVGRVNRRKLEKLMGEQEGSFALDAQNLRGASIAGAGGDLRKTMPHEGVLALNDSQLGTVTCYMPGTGDVMDASSTPHVSSRSTSG